MMRRALLGVLGVAFLCLAIALVLSARQPLREPGYRMIAQWGTRGDTPDALRDPTGITVAENKVFVSDARHTQIKVFSPQGQFLYAFPDAKSSVHLVRPMNLDSVNGMVFVPDYEQDKVFVFTLDGTFVRSFGSAGEKPGQFSAPSGVAVRKDGRSAVVDFYGAHVQLFSDKGVYEGVLAPSARQNYTYPSDVAVRSDGGYVVAEGYAHRLHSFSADGQHEHSFGGFYGIRLPGMPFNAWFKTVSSVAVGPKDQIFATDFYNGRIQVFDSRGQFITTFGKGLLKKPFGLAVDDHGDVYVVDIQSHRISVWRKKA